MAEFGIGVSVLRKEDDRFLGGGGRYVGDVRMAGMGAVALVRSPHEHRHPGGVPGLGLHGDNLVGVKPIISAPTLKGYKCQPSRRSRPARSFTAHRHSYETAARKGGRKIEIVTPFNTGA